MLFDSRVSRRGITGSIAKFLLRDAAKVDQIAFPVHGLAE